jgi:hypothetical protein
VDRAAVVVDRTATNDQPSATIGSDHLHFAEIWNGRGVANLPWGRPADPRANQPSHAPAASRAERVVAALLNSANLMQSLQAHLDQLDGEVIRLLRERSAQARAAGEAEGAAALDQLAGYVQALAEAAGNPAQTRAHETLKLILDADDVVAALEHNAHRLDGDVLELVRLNEQTARADGEIGLADGLHDLAQYVAARLSPVPQAA